MTSSLCIAAVALLCVSVHAGHHKSYDSDSDSDEKYGGNYEHRHHGGHRGHGTYGGYGGHHGHGGRGGGYGGYHGNHPPSYPNHPHHPHHPPHGPFPPGPPPTFPTKFPTGSTPSATATATSSTDASTAVTDGSTPPPTPNPNDPALNLCPSTKDAAPFLASFVPLEKVAGFHQVSPSKKACASCKGKGDIHYAPGQKSLQTRPFFTIGATRCANLCVCNDHNQCFRFNDDKKPVQAVFIPVCQNDRCDNYVTFGDLNKLDDGFGLIPIAGSTGKPYLVSDQKGELKNFLTQKSPIIRTISCGQCALIDESCQKPKSKRDITAFLNDDGKTF